MFAALLRGALLLALTLRVCLGGAFVSGLEHPNYGVQFPPHTFGPADFLLDVEDEMLLSLIQEQQPQRNYVFDVEHQLIGYLDLWNPARLVIWSPILRSRGLVATQEEQDLLLDPIPDPPDPQDETPIPEPSTLTLVPISLGILCVRRFARSKAR